MFTLKNCVAVAAISTIVIRTLNASGRQLEPFLAIPNMPAATVVQSWPGDFQGDASWGSNQEHDGDGRSTFQEPVTLTANKNGGVLPEKSVLVTTKPENRREESGESVPGSSKAPMSGKTFSILNHLQVEMGGLTGTNETIEPKSTAIVALFELYADYRFDALRSALDRIPVGQLSIEEVFLKVMCLQASGDSAGIKELAHRFENDDSIHGEFCRIAAQYVDGDVEPALSDAKKLADETGLAEAFSLHCMLLSYESNNRSAHHIAAAKAYWETFPNDLKANVEYGNALKHLGHEQAVEFLVPAAERFPNSSVLRNYLGHSLIQLNRLEEALAVYDSAIRIAPEYANLYYMRGGLAWKMGKVEQFELDTLKAAELNSDTRHVLASIEVLLRRGEFQQAIIDSKHLVDSDRNDHNLAYLAISLAVSGQINEARNVASGIGDLPILQVVKHFSNGFAAFSTGDKLAGIDQIIQAMNQYALPALCKKILQTQGSGIPVSHLTSDTQIRIGPNSIGLAKQGTVFRVRNQQGNWVEGEFLIDNKLVVGWVDQGSVNSIRF